MNNHLTPDTPPAARPEAAHNSAHTPRLPYPNVYFIGIGGIGMSALARYYAYMGARVMGYDLTPSEITQALQQEGIGVTFSDAVADLPLSQLPREQTLVVFTPAVPQSHPQLQYFRSHGYKVCKRAQALGIITAPQRALCVAGTHGKTTTSAMLTHLMNCAREPRPTYEGLGSIKAQQEAPQNSTPAPHAAEGSPQNSFPCPQAAGGPHLQAHSTTPADGDAHPKSHSGTPGASAFLGGIANNYGSNFLYVPQTDYVVAEADEYDRSFLQLSPYIAIVTSSDPDHLDIYGTHEAYLQAFEQFASQIKPGGSYIVHEGLPLNPRLAEGVKRYTYGAGAECSFRYDNIRVGNGRLLFDWYCPERGLALRDLAPGVPVAVNVENATAALGAALLSGVEDERLLRLGVESFTGTHRRFEKVLENGRFVLIDDYAHHPAELSASISSVKQLYAGREVMAVFQPHLYSRTADFYREFAAALSTLEHVVLLDIYPAREEPIPGVTSELIYRRLTCPHKTLLRKEELLDFLATAQIPPVVLMLGAGNIDRLVQPVKQLLIQRS